MENTLALYQIIVLYMLCRCGEEITKKEISTFLMEHGYVDFSELIALFDGLSKNGYIELRRDGEDQFVRVTDAGAEVLAMFRGQLPDRIRERVDTYLKENERSLRETRDVRSEYYDASYGGYLAHLKVRERQQTVLELGLHCPSEEMARRFAERMRGRSARLYELVMEELMREE